VYWDLTEPAATSIEYLKGFEGGLVAAELGMAVYLQVISNGRLIWYDPYTGSVAQNVSIAPLTTGTFYNNPYWLSVQDLGASKPDSQRYWLINWTITGTFSTSSYVNYHLTVMNNVSWPFNSLGSVDYEAGIAVNTYQYIPAATGVATDVYIAAARLTTGTLLYNVSANVGEGLFNPSCNIADHGKFAAHFMDGTWHCYDLTSGKQLWTNELSSYPWGIWGVYGVSSAYGFLYYPQYDGIVAYDWNTGKIAWHYSYTAPYQYETPYQNYYCFNRAIIIADGIIFAANTEHTPSQPITRGWKLHAINATTGEGIWNITGAMAQGPIADGYFTASNTYDGYMYVFGKGESATTVETPDFTVSKDTSITIKGTVMDMSPGDQGSIQNPTAPPDSPTKQGTVPCVSKDSMSTQMEYLYMQHPIDGLSHNSTIMGVPVHLLAQASDGTYTDLGTVTTNGYYGTFSYAWTPTTAGTYQIIASFAGDDSYGSSSAAAAVSVGPAPTATATPTATSLATTADLMTYIVIAAIAIIIAIVIIGAIAVLILRKR